MQIRCHNGAGTKMQKCLVVYALAKKVAYLNKIQQKTCRKILILIDKNKKEHVHRYAKEREREML